VGWSPSNGSSVSMRLTLPAAYSQGRIPSKSFGIHVGSVYHNISGSLMLGGYDRSRCITNPIVSDSATFQLVDISLGVAAGISSFIDLPQGNRKGLLRANGSALSELSVRPNPAVPYIYLPRDTCDAIASHLPVTYSSDFNLYLWDAEHPAYEQIIRSPHYLSFSFATGSGLTSSIDVPFALLNLTLDWPLTEIPTPYFPCSPWLATNDPHNFGRAFLQAAFLARDWQQGGRLYLAQAPGPDHSAPDVRTIAGGRDTSLLSLEDAPDWLSTWSSVLKAQPERSDNGSSTESATSSKSDEGTSTATIAGSTVGAIAGFVLVVGILTWWRLRRRRSHAAAAAVKSQQDIIDQDEKTSPGDGIAGPYSRVESAAETIHEAPTEPSLAELSGNHTTAELSVQTPTRL
jgi:hypothetical protein